MTTNIVMSKTEVYRARYRGIRFEINRLFWEGATQPQWTFYLILNEKELPEKEFKSIWDISIIKYNNHCFYRYDGNPIIDSIKWHYGCTYYEKSGGYDKVSNIRYVKMGCDYGHFHDIPFLPIESVILDVMAAINSLYELIPDIKIWCNICGEYTSDATCKDNGKVLCQKCIKKGAT